MPGTNPDATPEVDPIVATTVLLLVQVPPIEASLSAVGVPRHMLSIPVIGAGPETTETVITEKQPVPMV